MIMIMSVNGQSRSIVKYSIKCHTSSKVCQVLDLSFAHYDYDYEVDYEVKILRIILCGPININAIFIVKYDWYTYSGSKVYWYTRYRYRKYV